MKGSAEYLLKYISHDAYYKILKQKAYQLEDIINDRRDVELNIRYLLRLGIKNVDYVVFERIDDLLLSHHDFMNKINHYLEKISKEEFINMLENS